MMYEKPSSLFEQRLNEILSDPQETIVSNIMKIALLKRAKKDPDLLVFEELYSVLGLEDFMKLISIVDGKTITFPSIGEMRDTLTSCLCYFYKEVENKSWKEIKDLLGEENVNSIKEGIHSTQLTAFLKEMIGKMK